MTKLADNQIKHMVERFLGWRLPESFNPDAGISFKSEFNEHTAHPMKHEPTGTNLFDYGQAEEMIRHMLEGLPEAGIGVVNRTDIVERLRYTANINAARFGDERHAWVSELREAALAIEQARHAAKETVTREDAEVIRSLMEELYLEGLLEQEEERAFLTLCTAFGFGRPVRLSTPEASS